MLLTQRAKEWHESNGLLSSQTDFWQTQPTWQSKGVPKDLKSSGNYSFGMDRVHRVRLGEKHTVFSKHSAHIPASISQYIASQLAHHVGFNHAPVLLGPDLLAIHSLKMTFNVRSGSLLEALLEKVKNGDPDVPQELTDEYQEAMAWPERNGQPYSNRDMQVIARDVENVRRWKDDFVDGVYRKNVNLISQWVAFCALISDSEDIHNIGNIIVSMKDPTNILYFIDSHPNLDPSLLRRGSNFIEKAPVRRDGRFLDAKLIEKGCVDTDVVQQQLEVFRELMTDEVIEDTVFKASLLAGRLLADGSETIGSEPEYFRHIKDFYIERRDTLTCDF